MDGEGRLMDVDVRFVDDASPNRVNAQAQKRKFPEINKPITRTSLNSRPEPSAESGTKAL